MRYEHDLYSPDLMEKFYKSKDGGFSMFYKKHKEFDIPDETPALLAKYTYILLDCLQKDFFQFCTYFDMYVIAGGDRLREAAIFKIELTKDYTLAIRTEDMKLTHFALENPQQTALNILYDIYEDEIPQAEQIEVQQETVTPQPSTSQSENDYLKAVLAEQIRTKDNQIEKLLHLLTK